MEIKGDIKDIKFTVFFAFRYAMGRKTFAPNIMGEIIIDNIGLFNNSELKQMVSEINYADEMGGLGDNCDKATWMDLKKILMEVTNNDESN